MNILGKSVKQYNEFSGILVENLCTGLNFQGSWLKSWKESVIREFSLAQFGAFNYARENSRMTLSSTIWIQIHLVWSVFDDDCDFPAFCVSLHHTTYNNEQRQQTRVYFSILCIAWRTVHRRHFIVIKITEFFFACVHCIHSCWFSNLILIFILRFFPQGSDKIVPQKQVRWDSECPDIYLVVS